MKTKRMMTREYVLTRQLEIYSDDEDHLLFLSIPTTCKQLSSTDYQQTTLSSHNI